MANVHGVKPTNQAPTNACFQFPNDPRRFLGRFLESQYHRGTKSGQGVKGVGKLLLGPLLANKAFKVIHQPQIQASHPFAKKGLLVRPQRIQKIVGKLLRRLKENL